MLELTVSDYLYRKFPDKPEGDLTRIRAAAVQTAAFSAFSKEAHFDRYIKLGKGEEKAGARQRLTLLEDLFEAFNGALYLDQGRKLILSLPSRLFSLKSMRVSFRPIRIIKQPCRKLCSKMVTSRLFITC